LRVPTLRHGVALVVSVAALAGCATRADMLQIKQDQRETRALLADQQVAIEGLRRRIEMMRSEMSDPGRRKSGAALSSAAQQRLSDLEARVAALDQARPTAPTTVAPASVALERPMEAAAPPPEVVPTPAPPKQVNPQEAAIGKEEATLQGARVDSDYREAMGLIRQGQCSQAVPKLRDFIRKNPKSDFADNAQYWIGSCYYGQHDYNRAIIELNEVLLKYPKADKVPAALLMLADAFADSGDKIDARLILQKLISDHPKSEEADRGRQKLQSLGG
jgi:tol-pal system protein YbgF